MNFSELVLPKGLHVRMSKPSDSGFLQRVHNEKRDDLRLVEGEPDFIESLIELQFKAMNQGYGEQFPNAMYFIIEKQNEPIGRAVVDFSENQVHLVDLAIIKKARGNGFGEAVLRSFMHIAGKIGASMSLCVLSHNFAAKRLYLRLGFRVTSIEGPSEKMMWYPQAASKIYV
ncbi:GNAT family N-acetyltransferase [Pseudoalteromonas piscicida]|uniref:GNAT family N-acetyltransferase n=1 Tax=Pseudoalteromonas piscicida TaxID=43662 RepID=A0AAQ2EV97_PSEO7|nr:MULTISPECIES: GNAT family N-acetyltransferase [Pseudoalteromonas]KJY89644.1 acetyltransferase [Pseudoalteromonas piscicida]MDP4486388.1 GNAT family N-acetyltransferase [Pseudoalteromonas piscicida]TMN37250.1 GNAT family N-acetyltransferase [Pseudoalteromonas piscicida]TMN43829.1 GNAT family N-acetyltransferase [Pseudoalteromonas piscicida]TMN56743.1 GNAT family N-acetyltransferase [Pseudoalteromonas piscicida]